MRYSLQYCTFHFLLEWLPAAGGCTPPHPASTMLGAVRGTRPACACTFSVRWCTQRGVASAAGDVRVLGIGLGNMGAPLHGQIAAKFPTAVYDVDAQVAAAHASQWGSTAVSDDEGLRAEAAGADIIVTCLPNTAVTRAVWGVIEPALSESCGKVWIDTTSGRADEAEELAGELWSQHGIRYLDCAVSGGPAGARAAKLAALVGGDAPTFGGVAGEVIGCFADKITHLGPVGS
jgi:3-hydroxyisobutyrate dehydrogenase